MFHNKGGNVLKQGVLTKRATGRKRIKIYGFKERLFQLTESNLTYYEGNEEKKGREKGTIELSSIKVVERVDDNALDRKYCFQVQFDEFTLYVVSKNETEQMQWIRALRDEIAHRNTCLLQQFHPGVFTNNCWTCCKEKPKTITGCKNSYFYKEPGKVQHSQQAKNNSQNIQNKRIEKENFKVTAKYDYKPAQKDDLPLEMDQEYTVLDSSQKNWWLARDDLGREGYIPSNYVARHFGIESEKWYHGDLTRQEADAALKNSGIADGTFIVRTSSQPGMYTLSFIFQGVVKHYHIKLDPQGKYYVSQRHQFDEISSLIEYHKLNSAGLVSRLRFPYTGSHAPPVLGSGVFQIDRSELYIKRQIGTGQFGTVHEAVWRGKTKVAVKMMKPDTMSEHDFIEEAKVMQRFQHKNLVSMYGVCSLQSPLYIVVELMPNGSLLEYLRKNRHLLTKHTMLIDMVFQVCSAMKYLEEEKFIHRDLATRNCLVGEQNLIKVGDFGLARYVLDDQYTASEGTKFPVKWAAPEVIDYTKFSSKSDVWAFGILCWETFTAGKSPYATFSNQQVAEQVRKGYRMEKPQYCPNDIYKIIEKCWQQTPENRPSFKVIFDSLKMLTEDYSET